MSHPEPKHAAPLAVGSRYVRTRIHKGEVTVEAFGFQNQECLEATRTLEQRIGNISGRRMKDDGGELQRTN